MTRGENTWWIYSGSKPVALLLLAAMCLGGLYMEGLALLVTRPLTARDLGTPPIGRYVEVSCDSLEHTGRFDNGQRGYLCRLGSRILPIVGGRSDDEVMPSSLLGRLREFRNGEHYGRSDTGDVDFIWSDDVLTNPRGGLVRRCPRSDKVGHTRMIEMSCCPGFGHPTQTA